MIRFFSGGALALAGVLVAGSAIADGHVYSNFPITVKGYEGSKTSSVSYTGQVARHVLHDSIKAFKNLNKYGIIIFDDFLWGHEKDLKKTSTFALLNFMQKNNNKFKILYSNYQLIIQKN